MNSLASSFDPCTFESVIYSKWETAHAFQPSGQGPAYTVLLPPPNVTGTLHMGHAFQQTLMDALVRYHRMRGFDTLWQVGTDHAGIATEMVVNRELEREGKGQTRQTLGRERFIERVWEWKHQSGDTITQQMRRLGASADWSRNIFTMDHLPSVAVTEAFVRLYDEGLIYRGKRLVNWDPVLQTAISDLEVENTEENGFLWHIRYPLADGHHYHHLVLDRQGQVIETQQRDYLTVATTRPETLFGDSAIMVHPEDPRYASLIGLSVVLPLTQRKIPIIADAQTDPTFGTGVVKVTPAHDFNDYQVGLRHQLEIRNILQPNATLNANVPENYQNLDRFVARARVLEDLTTQGLLLETQPHVLHVPRGDRTGTIIEPYLTDQWFVKMETLAQRGLALVESGDVRFVPTNWINTYRHWLHNIQDWCISRQLWWGHRIPAWYDPNGKIYVGHDEQSVRTRNGLSSDIPLRQDDDVVETWFSSQLWPLSTFGWPDKQKMQDLGFHHYLPSSVLVTGFDIIFFWVARMIMATDHFVAQVPFHAVYITGLVRDAHGKKMSKSKGNVIDPLDIIDGIDADALVEKRTHHLLQPQLKDKIAKQTRKEFPEGITAHGADALRFTITALASHGTDIAFDLRRAEGYKNFCNKLWNAARFVLMHTQEMHFEKPSSYQPVTEIEQWILQELSNTIAQSHQDFALYRFDLLAQHLYEFAWGTFCDWFLELSKPALQGDDLAIAQSTRHTLLFVLEQLLRLLHPIIPFITEELWQHIAPALGLSNGLLCQQPYPCQEDINGLFAHAACDDVDWLKDIIASVRHIRSSLGLSPARRIRLLLQHGNSEDTRRSQRFNAQLQSLLKLDSLEWLTHQTNAPPAAKAIIRTLHIFVPLEGLVDLDAERTRLRKQIQRIESEIQKCTKKLNMPTFVSNAPESVVMQERERLTHWNDQRDGLCAQYNLLRPESAT